MGNTYGTTRSRPYSATYPPATQSAHTVRRWPTRSGVVHRGQHLVAVRLGADHPGALRPDRGQQHPGPLGHLGARRPAAPSQTSPPGSWRRHASSQTTRQAVEPGPSRAGGRGHRRAIAGCGIDHRDDADRGPWAQDRGPAVRADGVHRRRARRGRRARHRVAGRAGPAGGPGRGPDRGDRARPGRQPVPQPGAGRRRRAQRRRRVHRVPGRGRVGAGRDAGLPHLDDAGRPGLRRGLRADAGRGRRASAPTT